MLEKLNLFLNSIPHAEEIVVVTVAGVVDLVLRLLKTEKPLSLALVLAKGLRLVAAICEKIAVLLDKILPQRVKSE